MLFDGSDEYVNIDSVQVALAATTVGTWSAWVKPIDATPAALEVLISFGDTNASTRIWLYIDTAGKLNGFCAVGGVNQWLVVTDAAAFSDNTWVHIAMVQDGTAAAPELFVNGTKPAQPNSISTDNSLWLDTAGLDNGRIANDSFGSSGEERFFNGNIDEVLFINRALTQPQIADIYNSGAPKNESAIANGVSYFRMGDKGTYAGGVWTFPDQIGSNDAVSVNMEEADRELDVP